MFALVSHILQVENEGNDSNAFEELGRLGEVLNFSPEGNFVVTGKRKKNTTGTKKQRPEEPRIQYATRGKKHSYCEADVPEDDHYICEFIIVLQCSQSVPWGVDSHMKGVGCSSSGITVSLKADLHGTIFAYDCRMRFL